MAVSITQYTTTDVALSRFSPVDRRCWNTSEISWVQFFLNHSIAGFDYEPFLGGCPWKKVVSGKMANLSSAPKGDFPSDKFQSCNIPSVQFPQRQLLKGYVRPSDTPQAAIGDLWLLLGWARGAESFGKIG